MVMWTGYYLVVFRLKIVFNWIMYGDINIFCAVPNVALSSLYIRSLVSHVRQHKLLANRKNGIKLCCCFFNQ